jgi:hypothetical protein
VLIFALSGVYLPQRIEEEYRTGRLCTSCFSVVDGLCWLAIGLLCSQRKLTPLSHIHEYTIPQHTLYPHPTPASVSSNLHKARKWWFGVSSLTNSSAWIFCSCKEMHYLWCSSNIQQSAGKTNITWAVTVGIQWCLYDLSDHAYFPRFFQGQLNIGIHEVTVHTTQFPGHFIWKFNCLCLRHSHI